MNARVTRRDEWADWEFIRAFQTSPRHYIMEIRCLACGHITERRPLRWAGRGWARCAKCERMHKAKQRD